MSFKLSRKASLDLSVNSIVVMVIAFVVLGLILTFTRGIFSFGQGQLNQIVNVVDLAEKPTSENTIVPRSMTLIAGQAGQKVSMGFYNAGSTNAYGVKLKFGNCIGTDSDGTVAIVEDDNKKPILTMIATGTVQPSKSVGITALISTKADTLTAVVALGNGDYVCPLIAEQTKSADGTTLTAATKLTTSQISVKVG